MTTHLPIVVKKLTIDKKERVLRDVEIYYIDDDCKAAIKLVGVLFCDPGQNFDDFLLMDYYVITADAAKYAINTATPKDVYRKIYEHFDKNVSQLIITILTRISEKSISQIS